MVDLVCRRYPGRRPSDYLEVSDPWVALQLDFAVAHKHETEEFKYDSEKLEAIQEMLKPIGSALGVKYEAKQETKVLPDDLPVDTVLSILGGKGIKVERHGGK
jgi:hypothetical protein